MNCIRCGREETKPDDVVEFVCSTCTFLAVALHEAQLHEQRQKYDPARLKQIRNELGWTQRELAFKLNIPSYKVGRFEREEELPCKEIMEFIDEY